MTNLDMSTVYFLFALCIFFTLLFAWWMDGSDDDGGW